MNLGKGIAKEEVDLCQQLQTVPENLDKIRRLADELGGLQRLKQLVDGLCSQEAWNSPGTPATGGQQQQFLLDHGSQPPKKPR